MISIADAQQYSIGAEIVYQIEYSDGTKVRAIESPSAIIRRQYLNGGEWVECGKNYTADRAVWNRAAERIKAEVLAFLA